MKILSVMLYKRNLLKKQCVKKVTRKKQAKSENVYEKRNVLGKFKMTSK